MNKTFKKVLSIALSLAMVLTSITVYNTTTKADDDFKITKISWKKMADGTKAFDVEFSSAYAEGKNKDPYFYCVYLDEIDSEHSAINYGATWNWKSNLTMGVNANGGFHNNYKFDEIFSIASVITKPGNYLEEGTHKVIVAAYGNVEDAKADVNPINTVEKTLIYREGRVDSDNVATIDLSNAEIDSNNGITVRWTHPEGMGNYKQEFYFGKAGEIVEDEDHWARNGASDYLWGNVTGRQYLDNVVTTKDYSLNVANGGEYAVRVVYINDDDEVVARGTTKAFEFEKTTNNDMQAFQERNVNLTVYLKWKKVTGGNRYSVFDENGKEVKNNIVGDYADVTLEKYNTEYKFTIKAYDVSGNEIDVVNNVVVAKVEKKVATIDGEEATITDGKVKLGNAEYGYFCNGQMYKPETEVEVNGEMNFTSVNKLDVSIGESASIRYKGETGLRFKTDISTDNLAILSSNAVTEGTLITTSDLYEKDNNFNLKSEYAFINVVNKGWYAQDEAEKTYSYCGSVVQIKDYTRNFVAKSYVAITYTDGETIPYYSTGIGGPRSIQKVAQAVKEHEYMGIPSEFRDIIDKYANGNSENGGE